MQIQHPEQQHSSLGISKALEEEVRLFEDGNSHGQVRKSLTDAMFKAPSKEANIFVWTRFIISLYYNKVCFTFLQLYFTYLLFSWQ